MLRPISAAPLVTVSTVQHEDDDECMTKIEVPHRHERLDVLKLQVGLHAIRKVISLAEIAHSLHQHSDID